MDTMLTKTNTPMITEAAQSRLGALLASGLSQTGAGSVLSDPSLRGVRARRLAA